jgi:lysophospholipase L1-like esterase
MTTAAPRTRFRRFVALGDSQTEGVGDGDDATGLVGWADRLAFRLAEAGPDLEYANLAVRGRLAGQVRAEQLPAALALEPDLATVSAGLNDVLRPRFDAAGVAREVEGMFRALTAAGARVATLTYPNIALVSPLLRPLAPRLLRLNALLREAAARHDVAVADFEPHASATDPRLWQPDRLHANSVGHDRIAAAMAEALGVPGSDGEWSLALPPRRVGPTRVLGTELAWIGTFVGPWTVRRVRGRSSGDGRVAKRPLPTPVLPAGGAGRDAGT